MNSPKIDALPPTTLVDCAVLLALSGIPGTRMEVLLALKFRTGRHPALVIRTDASGIMWRCADGSIEQPSIALTDHDHPVLIEEINLNGLLVAEYDDIDAEGAQPRNHWLIEAVDPVLEEGGQPP